MVMDSTTVHCAFVSQKIKNTHKKMQSFNIFRYKRYYFAQFNLDDSR